MSENGAHGPEVEPHENLYRAITVPQWWRLDTDPPQVSSFAFKVDTPFSANIASVIGLAGAVGHMEDVLHCPHGGIVEFNCGISRTSGFNARRELDLSHPTNRAHANVYYEGSNSRRKHDAKKLADACRTVHRPTF